MTNDPNKSVDSNSPNPDSTPSSVDFGKFSESVAALTNAVQNLEAKGASREAATRQVAQDSGLSTEALEQFINEADGEGNLGKGVVQVLQTVASSFQAQTLDREGRREVDALKTHDDFTRPIARDGEKEVTVFQKYGPGFKQWMQENNYSYANAANPDAAAKLFRFYLVNSTDFLDKRDEYITKRASGAAQPPPTGKRAAPSLRPGAAPEGGIGARLVAGVYDDAEATENQDAIMAEFGFDEEKKKKAMEAQRLKTSMGTPLTFVNTRNEGGV